jgi:hypothetical protein
MSTEQDPKIVVSVMSAEEKVRRLGDPDLPPQFNEITITGNRAGLCWLAGRVRTLVEADPGTHIHLDRGAHAPIYTSSEDWWLTLVLEEDAEMETP